MAPLLDRDHALSLDLGAPARLGISADDGRHWQFSAQPGGLPRVLPDGTMAGAPFFLDPADGWLFDHLTGTGRLALWRTTNGGRAWTDLAPQGIPMAVAEGLPSLVFVDQQRGACAWPVAPGPWPAVVSTGDGGSTWQPVALTWPTVAITSAVSWFAVPALLAYRNRLVHSLDIVPAGTGAAQVVRRFSSVSGDGGQTWSSWVLMFGIPNLPSRMVVDDRGTLVVAAGRHRWTSVDLGRAWRVQSLPGPDGEMAAVVSARGGALFVRMSASGGPPTLLRSIDGGAHWTRVHLPSPSGATN